MTVYGEYNADGSIKTPVDECAITGRYVDNSNSARERVPGTDVFYRIRQTVYEDVTDDQRREIWANAPVQPTKKAAKAVLEDAQPATAATGEPLAEPDKKGTKP